MAVVRHAPNATANRRARGTTTRNHSNLPCTRCAPTVHWELISSSAFTPQPIDWSMGCGNQLELKAERGGLSLPCFRNLWPLQGLHCNLLASIGFASSGWLPSFVVVWGCWALLSAQIQHTRRSFHSLPRAVQPGRARGNLRPNGSGVRVRPIRSQSGSPHRTAVTVRRCNGKRESPISSGCVGSGQSRTGITWILLWSSRITENRERNANGTA